MKCLIINGSPRKANTYTIAQEAIKQLSDRGDYSFTEVHLIKEDIPICRGCASCILKGEHTCPHSDKIQTIAQKIEESDLLIVISPVYSLMISSLLKNYIDHMSYMFHRPRYFDKRAIVITSTAGAGARASAKYIRDVLKHWGFNRIYTLPVICQAIIDYKITPQVMKRLVKLINKIHNDITVNKLYSPTIKRVFYYNLWRAFSGVGSYENSADYRYWQDNLMWSKTYAKSIPMPFYKMIIGNAVYRLMLKMFSIKKN